jgi:hypothetical protein
MSCYIPKLNFLEFSTEISLHSLLTRTKVREYRGVGLEISGWIALVVQCTSIGLRMLKCMNTSQRVHIRGKLENTKLFVPDMVIYNDL